MLFALILFRSKFCTRSIDSHIKVINHNSANTELECDRMAEPRRRINVFEVPPPVVKVDEAPDAVTVPVDNPEQIRLRSKSLILHNRPPGLLRSSFLHYSPLAASGHGDHLASASSKHNAINKRYWFQRRGSHGHHQEQLQEEER